MLVYIGARKIRKGREENPNRGHQKQKNRDDKSNQSGKCAPIFCTTSDASRTQRIDTHQGGAARDLAETSATRTSTVDVGTHLQRLSLQLAGMAKATEERDAGLLDLGGPSLLVPPLRFVTERSVDRAFAAGTMLQIALYAPLLSLFVKPLALLVNE